MGYSAVFKNRAKTIRISRKNGKENVPLFQREQKQEFSSILYLDHERESEKKKHTYVPGGELIGPRPSPT